MTLEDVEKRIDFLESCVYYDCCGSSYLIEELVHWKEQVAKWEVYNGHGLEYDFEKW